MLRAMNKILLLAIGLPFAAVSAVAVVHHGYLGIFEAQFASWAGIQVLADLVVALLLVMGWMWRDARQQGRNPWPWIVLTLVAGSFGPLGYLLTRRPDAIRSPGTTRPA